MNRAAPDPQKIESYLTSIRDRFEDRFGHLVEIPTISMDPAHRDDIDRGARAAAALLQECGARAEVVPTSGNPVVMGEFVVSWYSHVRTVLTGCR